MTGKSTLPSRLWPFAAIDQDWVPLCVLEMAVEHMTGKEAIELVR